MKISLTNETVVYYGPRNEDSAWGFVQFPKFYEMKNGSIGLYFHNEDDSPLVLGQGSWYVSDDLGKSWHNASKEEFAQFGTLLPNGDMLRIKNIPAKKVENLQSSGAWFGNYRIPSEPVTPQKSTNPNVLPHPISLYSDVFGSNDFFYLLDTLPDGLAENRLFFSRLKNGKTTAEEEYSPVDWKHRTVRIFSPSPVYTGMTSFILENPAAYEGGSKLKVAPDGSLFLALYRNGPCNPYTGKFEKFSAVFLLRSTDNGKTWGLHGYIPYQPDLEKDEFSYLHGGFYEPDIEFMPDGTMLCIMRTCDVFQGAPEWGATYLSRSTDGGKSWSKPEYFKEIGALPLLLRLDCGVILAVVTRPGIFVYASKDNGKTWTACAEIMTDKDRSNLANVPPSRPNFHQWAGSCCNTDVRALDCNRALLVFSDFYTPDPSDNGIKKKAIKTVEIVVDC